MRLWSLHPSYLDSAGLVALWREALLAQEVLQGRTMGYRHHPQLTRFRNVNNPEGSIAAYLGIIFKEAQRRGYNFDERKIACAQCENRITVTRGQVAFEFTHLQRKLWKRDRARFYMNRQVSQVRCHNLFRVRPGQVEEWELSGMRQRN